VLIDFWTYSCINCLRTLPYLKAWDAKYRKDGLDAGTEDGEDAAEIGEKDEEHGGVGFRSGEVG
jgi:thiol-disulfide isomerase/thioredoxin